MNDPSTVTVPSVLIIDDEPADVYMAKHILGLSGRFGSVLVAEDGEQALQMFRDYEQTRAANPEGFPPLVILLDINMPRMDGFEFLSAYETSKASFPPGDETAVIVMVTTSNASRDRARAEAFPSVRGCLTKPIAEDDAHDIANRFGQTSSS